MLSKSDLTMTMFQYLTPKCCIKHFLFRKSFKRFSSLQKHKHKSLQKWLFFFSWVCKRKEQWWNLRQLFPKPEVNQSYTKKFERYKDRLLFFNRNITMEYQCALFHRQKMRVVQACHHSCGLVQWALNVQWNLQSIRFNHSQYSSRLYSFRNAFYWFDISTAVRVTNWINL